MDNELLTVDTSQLCIMIDQTLTDYDRMVLVRLYQPIIKQKALSIFHTLYSEADLNTRESGVIHHRQILNSLGMNQREFIIERSKLEAVGLLKTYYKDQLYIYVLSRVLSPYEFFQNGELSQIFTLSVGGDATKIARDLIVRSLEPRNFEDITCSFDEVYNVIDPNFSKEIMGVDTRNYGINVKNSCIDLNLFILLTGDGLISMEFLRSEEFLNLVKRYAFIFGLKEKELSTCAKLSATPSKTVDLNEFLKQVKLTFDKMGQTLAVLPINNKDEYVNKQVETFEKISQNQLVSSKYKIGLTSSEIMMFEELKNRYNLSNGFMNVLLYYVLDKNNGKVPNSAYFIKVITSWLRQGITSTFDALEYIQNPNPKNKNRRTVVEDPWKDKTTSKSNIDPTAVDDDILKGIL